MCRQEDNIKMDLKDMGCYGVDWIYVAKNLDNLRALVNRIIKFLTYDSDSCN
jgi:hypothetical protein